MLHGFLDTVDHHHQQNKQLQQQQLVSLETKPMASFFSLVPGSTAVPTPRPTADDDDNDHHHHHHHHATTTSVAAAATTTTNQVLPDNWFLYRNNVDDSAFKGNGFELWQHQQEENTHDQHQVIRGTPYHANNPYTATTTATGRTGDRYAVMMGASASGGGTVSCQDCGNQAKKDCAHMRCRACCKSRGFQCATHVKSTWIPAAKRRERLQQLGSLQQQLLPGGGGGGDANKRLRSENAGLTSSLAQGMKVGDFPSEASSAALFRCVRVSSMEEAGENQYAYQTAVNIGGHVFKGILYDQGPEGSYPANSGGEGGESSSGTGGAPPPLPLNLIPDGSASSVAAVAAGPSSTAMKLAGMGLLDPSLYQQSGLSSYLVAGAQFYPSPRP